MYRLKSSDLDNSKYIDALENNSELFDQICSTWKADTLKFFIYNEELDEKSYQIYATALSCGDSLKVPILESEARMLWFVLSVNYANLNKEFDLKISSPVHAKYLYDLCNGDFRELDLQNDHSEKKHREAYCRFMARHTALFPEKNIYWEIPVSHYKNQCMVSGSWATFAYATIGDQKVKIPRSIFIKFFKNSIIKGKIVGNNSNEIRLFFDETETEPLWETLTYMGYELFKKIKIDNNIDYYYDKDEDGLIAHLLNREAQLFENNEESIYWNEISPNTYRYLKPGEDYLPIKKGKQYIYIYKN